MRNLIISRIIEFMRVFPDMLYLYDINEDSVKNLSNLELLDLYVEIIEDLIHNNLNF